jgi:hypothetical protein
MQGRLSSLPVHGTFQCRVFALQTMMLATGELKVARTGRQECLP